MPPAGRRNRVRPWWGLGDVVLALPVIVLMASLGAVAALPFLTRDELDSLFGRSMVETPLPIVALSLVGQQLAQGLWPILVAYWKGRGPVIDWRLRFAPVDLVIGTGTAVAAVGFAALAAAVVSAAVGLEDEAEAANTQFLTDAEGSPWQWLLIASVVVGAPLAEELLFRGLILRAIEKRAGLVVAVIGSTLLFTLPHFTGSSLAGTLVLFASIGVVGLVLGVVTAVVDRLWPAVIAHMLFNGFGVLAALSTSDSDSALRPLGL